MDKFRTLEIVQNYYGKVLGSSADLQMTACCSAEAMPRHLLPILKEIHPEVTDRFYGCGSPLPSELEGRTVLDLGCGTGRDCYLLSKLVGPSGKVIGIDMTDEQLSIARRHVDYHTEKFGFAKPNVEFVKGYIEDLESVGIQSGSVDVIVSNCVVNLSPAKDRVFSEVFRVLKEGGEIYFSDVYADRRIPEDVRVDPVLLGECLGGALYTEDFRRIMNRVGFSDFRFLSKAKLGVENPALRAKVGMVQFYSITARGFKLPHLEDRCEDFGQSAYYLGTISETPEAFVLDDHHRFQAGVPLRVCSNTALMLSGSRLGKHFKIIGDLSTHFGVFDCAPVSGVVSETAGAVPGVVGTGGCC